MCDDRRLERDDGFADRACAGDVRRDLYQFRSWHWLAANLVDSHLDPTLPRFGSDFIQVHVSDQHKHSSAILTLAPRNFGVDQSSARSHIGESSTVRLSSFQIKRTAVVLQLQPEISGIV